MDLLFYELLELVSHELHLGSDDDLHGGLSGTDDAGYAGGLEGLLIHQEAILDLEAQAVMQLSTLAMLPAPPTPASRAAARAA